MVFAFDVSLHSVVGVGECGVIEVGTTGIHDTYVSSEAADVARDHHVLAVDVNLSS